MAGITAANVILTLQQAILFPAPVQLQGYANDDVTDLDVIQMVETMMGVDGKLSGGFVFVPVTQNIALMADSESNDVLDAIATQQAAAKDVYPLNGVMLAPSIGKKWTFTRGFLTGWKPAPDVKRTLQPRRHAILWQSVVPSPMV